MTPSVHIQDYPVGSNKSSDVPLNFLRTTGTATTYCNLNFTDTIALGTLLKSITALKLSTRRATRELDPRRLPVNYNAAYCGDGSMLGFLELLRNGLQKELDIPIGPGVMSAKTDAGHLGGRVVPPEQTAAFRVHGDLAPLSARKPVDGTIRATWQAMMDLPDA